MNPLSIGFSIYVFTALLSFASCITERSIFYDYDEGNEDSGDLYECQYLDSLIEISYGYVGATPNYFIFELNMVNRSAEDHLIQHQDFTMDVKDGLVSKAYWKDEVLEILDIEQEALKKEKKKRTVWNAILTGLEIVLTSGQGVSVGESLLYSAEPVFYIFDERRFYERNIRSSEEERAYVIEYTLDEAVVAGHDSVSFDLLFPLQPIISDVDIIYTHARHERKCRMDRSTFDYSMLD